MSCEEQAVKGYAWTEVFLVNGYEGAKEVIDYASLSMKESQIKMAKALAKQCIVSKLKIARRLIVERFNLDNSYF